MAALERELIHHLLRLSQAAPTGHVWTEYDDSADVLYISFRKPQGANDSVMEDDGNIYHYRDSELVGVTVLNASQVAAG